MMHGRHRPPFAIPALALLVASLGLRAAQPEIHELAKPVATTPFTAKISALRSARDAGLPWVAEDLAAELLAQPGAPAGAPDTIRLLLADTRIQRGAYREASQTLDGVTGAGASKSLRLGIIARALGRTDEAARHLAATPEAALDTEEAFWRETLAALLQSDRGDIPGAQTRLAALKGRARHPQVSAQIAILALRARLADVPKPTDPILEFGRIMDILSDSRQTYQLGKTQALSLARAGRKAEALARLDSLPVPDRDLRAERDLLRGMISGGRSPDGRKALLSALDAEGFKDIQSLALDALVEAVAATPREELVFQANPVYDELTARIESPAPSGRTRSIEAIADRIHFARARLMLIAASAVGPQSASAARDKAAEALEKILSRPNADPAVYADSLLFSAEIAREAGAFRKAAVAYEKLASLPHVSDAAGLRLLAADCYRENGDHANASAAYAEARRHLDAPAKRGDALVGEISSLLKIGRTEDAARTLATPGDADRDSVLRATWLVADARRREGANLAAMSLVKGVLASAPPPEPGLRLRFLWLRALLELATAAPANAAKTANEITTLVAVTRAGEIRDNTAAILAQTALLRARAALVAGDAGDAAAGFKTLRDTYPDSLSAASSYVVEGRHLAADGRHAEALDVFRKGYELHRKSADRRVIEAAHDALFSAAVEALALADRQADRPGRSHLDDAFNLLDRLTIDLAEYPDKEYAANRFHRARLMQGDILRRLNNFDSAEKLYEDLARKLPDHPDRLRADIARADCILQKAAARPEFYPVAAAEYERLASLPDRPEDLAAEAGYKRAVAVSKSPVKGAGDPGGDARLARREAAKILWLRTDELLRHAAELGPRGRHWLSRSLLLLSDLEAEDGLAPSARNALRRLLETNAAIADESRRLPGSDLARRKLETLSATPPTASEKS